MKLRIHGDSIRVRLNRREVAQFREQGCIRDVLVYGDGVDEMFAYGLETGPYESMRVRITPGQIGILVPNRVADEWINTDLVAISGEQQTKGACSVHLLIEKEFRRIHGGNTDPDLYPNPLENAQ